MVLAFAITTNLPSIIGFEPSDRNLTEVAFLISITTSLLNLGPLSLPDIFGEPNIIEGLELALLIISLTSSLYVVGLALSFPYV